MAVFLHFWDRRAQKQHVNMLVKLSPGVNFTNTLHAAFTLVDPNSAK